MRFTEISETENSERVLYSIGTEDVYAVADQEGIPREQVEAAMPLIERCLEHGFECWHDTVLEAITEGIRNGADND